MPTENIPKEMTPLARVVEFLIGLARDAEEKTKDIPEETEDLADDQYHRSQEDREQNQCFEGY